MRCGDRLQRVVEIRMNKAHPVGETEFARQPARYLDGGGGEIEADHFGAALRQRQAVRAEMALQVYDALTLDRRELCLLDGVEPAASGAEVRQVVAPGADMDPDTLIPIGAIGAVPLRFGHGALL